MSRNLLTKFALLCLFLLTACKDTDSTIDLSVGPIDRFQGIELGAAVSEFVGGEIENDEVFRLGGELFGVEVGVIRDFSVDWRPGDSSFVFPPNSLTTDIFYNLETRSVFLAISTFTPPFFESDCRIWGEEVRRVFEQYYSDVEVTLRSPEHGSVVIRPNRRDDESGFERQNTVRGECPVGYRLTPNQPTHYEIWFSNGQLYEEVVRGSDLLPSPIL